MFVICAKLFVVILHAKCLCTSPPVLGFNTDKQISTLVVKSFNAIPSGIVVYVCFSNVVMQFHENSVLVSQYKAVSPENGTIVTLPFIQKAATAQYGSWLVILHVS